MRQWWARGGGLTVAVIVVALTACSDSGAPATTPVVTTLPETSTTMPPATTSTTTSTTTSSTTTTLAPTTTVDRITEVQAIIQDLEERRLDALFREDEEAFRALFANDAYLELSLEVLGNLTFVAEPTNVIVEVRNILADTEDCLAAEVTLDLRQSLGEQSLTTKIYVLERPQGVWGYSYGGTGWTCDGPNPLDEP